VLSPARERVPGVFMARDQSLPIGAVANPPASLADYVAVLRRRKWIVLVVPVLAALVGFEIARGEPARYKAQATVLVNRSAGIVSGITNVNDPTVYDSVRYLNTQADIARSPELAARVAAAARIPGLTAGEVLGASSVTPETDADVLDISVTDRSGPDAVTIANAYANEFTAYKTKLDTARINDAIQVLQARAERMQKRGQTASGAYQTLSQYLTQLQTAARLTANSVSVLRPAQGATQVSPHPRRDLVLGALLGLVVALALAFGVDALDRRVRSEDEIEGALQLPLLGRVPRPPRRLRRRNELVMITEPLGGAAAETFRKLRTSIEFRNLDHGARTIMFTSTLPGEGKSTTVANLAVAFARAGRRVALIDLDIRKPDLHSFFKVGNHRGFTDVVLKRSTLDEAICPLELRDSWLPESIGGPFSSLPKSENGRLKTAFPLSLLPCGSVPPGGSEFLRSDRVSAVLGELAERFDLVLIDTPPILLVDDAMAFSANVDAMVVITCPGIKRTILNELVRQVRSCRATNLGFVLTGVSHRDGDGYGYGVGRGYGAHMKDVLSQFRQVEHAATEITGEKPSRTQRGSAA
jgi:tyrosine-protein kinase